MGPLVSGKDSRIVATFSLNEEDIRVGRVWRSYLAGHLNNVMHNRSLKKSCTKFGEV